ncbi:MAG: RsmB/NOP family class I SAM-dependent RNA methyltransferase [Oliverpabstia sp.]|nr:RsmB/NOP family class I SAM-dependent RNA methyltransferase [Oliverpabstia sp.]
MRQELPEAFEKRMREMLGEEYQAYLDSYQETRQYGLRVNPLKVTGEELKTNTSFHLRPIPWILNGYFYSEEDQPARHPYYTAGLYYLQEPSAMTPASRLAVKPGERVLDLCAAPGGKATALGAALQGKGVLVANDISNARAKALLKNLELFGISNAFVTNEIPGKLAESFEGFFDKVLVDAPCSGEGMFRKDPAVIKTWEEERPAYFAKLQKDILKNAVKMLRPGGALLYSTCTFAPVENEGSISWMLENFPEMELLPMESYEGFSQGHPEWGNGDPTLSRCVRIWPHRMNGEGHFLALAKKAEEIPEEKIRIRKIERTDKKSRQIIQAFFEECTWKPDWEQIEIRGDKVYLVPELPDKLQGIHFLRNGLYMGDMKKDRFEPSQQLAMTLNADQYTGVLRLKPEDERVERYLRGETILVEKGESSRQKGWILVCVDNFSLGWGKLVNGVLKNKYWGGWRKN